MNVKDKLVKLKIPTLSTHIGNGYISAGVRQGGSYLNNYHKSLPKLLLGSIHSTSESIHIRCVDVEEDVLIEVRGIIENEYLLEDLELSVDKLVEGFELVDRVPYAEWSFRISARDIYTSNLEHITLKLVGNDSEGRLVELRQYLPVTLEEDCLDMCQNAEREAYSEFDFLTLNTPFKVTVNGEIIYTSSLYELKQALLDRGVDLTLYQRMPN